MGEEREEEERAGGERTPRGPKKELSWYPGGGRGREEGERGGGERGALMRAEMGERRRSAAVVEEEEEGGGEEKKQKGSMYSVFFSPSPPPTPPLPIVFLTPAPFDPLLPTFLESLLSLFPLLSLPFSFSLSPPSFSSFPPSLPSSKLNS